VTPGEIKLTWDSGYTPALAIYEELTELEGDYWEYYARIAGEVRCHGGNFTHVDKSEEFAAEMEAWEATSAKEHDDQFYADILKFVAGEPNGITSGTVGETHALIAKRLVAEEPGLVVPGRRAELMEKISSIYDRDHAVHVTLSDADIALPASRLKNTSRSERNSPRYSLAAQEEGLKIDPVHR